MFKIEPKIIKSISADEFLDYLQYDLGFSEEYLKMVSGLLFEEGIIFHESGDTLYAQNVLEKAKVLITYMLDSRSTFFLIGVRN